MQFFLTHTRKIFDPWELFFCEDIFWPEMREKNEQLTKFLMRIDPVVGSFGRENSSVRMKKIANRLKTFLPSGLRFVRCWVVTLLISAKTIYAHFYFYFKLVWSSANEKRK